MLNLRFGEQTQKSTAGAVKLKRWSDVKVDILNLLHSEAADSHEFHTTLTDGLQQGDVLRHAHHLKCLTILPGMCSTVFAAHHGAGVTNQINFWKVSHDQGVEMLRCEVKPDITELIFVAKHRIFVGFCTDFTIRVFGDASNKFSELSITPCKHHILSLAFIKEFDHLVAGGAGCLLRYHVGSNEGFKKLRKGPKFKISLQRDEWVKTLKIDGKNKQLLALCESGIYILNYETNTQAYFFANRHRVSLTCCAFYSPYEYFITSAADGTIKVWNAVVFIQVHEFRGHFGQVTTLTFHAWEPILISCSLDGTIRLWRLDTLEIQQRIDVGENIYGMRFITSRKLAYWTQTQIKLWTLNTFHSLFSAIVSRVHVLRNVSVAGKPSRIVVSADDGGIRILSPVTGTIITIVYPVFSYQVVKQLAYDRKEEDLYVVLNSGEVLVYDCSTNPCQIKHKLWPVAADENIVSVCPFRLPAAGEEESETSEHLIFAGRRDGQITLLNAEKLWMGRAVQAHSCGNMIMECSLGSRGCNVSIGAENRLLTTAYDGVIKIWQVNVQLDTNEVSLTMMKKIKSDCIISHLCMMGDCLCAGFMGSCSVVMYKFEDSGSSPDDTSVHVLQHQEEDEHTKEISGLAFCYKLQIFATTADDGILKIWDCHNQLVRALVFDSSLQGVCFANDRGDILVGYQNHIHVVPIQSYLPIHILQQLLLTDFQDSLAEDAVPFDDKVDLWFDVNKLKAYPADLKARRQRLAIEAAEAEPDVFSLHLRAFGDLQSYRDKFLIGYLWNKRQSHLEQIKSYTEDIGRPSFLSSAELDLTTGGRTKRGPAQDDIGERLDIGGIDLSDSEQTEGRGSKLSEAEKQPEYADRSTVTMEIAAQKSVSHADVLKRKFPIAPDGFIPNSVIRKIIRPPKPEPVRQPSPWKLKPVTLIPTVEEEEWKSLHGSVSVASDSEIVTRAFVWDESDEEIEESFEDEIPVSAPPTRKQVTIVTPIGEVSAKEEITPVTIAKPEEQPVVSKAKIQVAPSKAGKEPTKKSGRRKKKKPVSTIDEEESMLPDEEKVRGLLDEIAEEVWFPQDIDMDLENVLSALLSLKQGAVSPPVYKQICNYLVRIQSELGYTAEQLDTVINELVTDLSNISGVIRCYATRTLGDLGMDRKTILMGLLPNLIDKEQSVRQETSQALTRLTGIENKDSLLALLKNIGSLKQDEVGTKKDAGGVLASLSERVTAVSKPVSYDTERIGSWVQHLAVTPGGEADELFEEQVLEADGSVKRDTKRSKGLESQGRVSIDSKRPGIPASVSKPGRDFERFKTQHARAPGERLSDEDLMYEDETYVTEVTIDGAELQHLRRGDVTGKMVYDQAGNLVYVETGKPVYDETGKPIYDETGKPIYDETGKLIYDKTGDQLPIPGGSPHRLRISQYSPSPFALSKEAYGRSNEGEPFYSSMSKSDHFLKTDLVSVHSSTSQLSSWSKGPYDKKLLPHNEELYSTYRKQDVMLSGAQLKTISDTEKPESPHEAAAAGAIKADDKVDKIPAASADGPKSYAGELKFTTVGKDSKRPTGTPVYLESGATPELGSLRFYNQQQGRKGSLLMGIDSSGQAAAVVQSSESKSFKKEDDEQNTAQRQGILKQRLLGTGDLNQIVESDTGVGTDLESEMLSVSFEPGAQLLEQHRRDGRLMLEEETVDGHIIVNITVQSNDEFSFEDSGLVSSDDSSSYHAKAGPRLYRRAVPQLSAIRSAADLDIPDTENWRSFFDHPSSQERRKSRRESANEGMRDKSVLPPIRYIGEECKLVPADVGVRLLHSVTVQSKLKEKPEDADRKNYRIDALPGRLSVHTNADDSGYSKYGVLKMHWTTKMPSSLAENPYKPATSSSRRSKYPTPGKHCRHDANFSELSKLKHSRKEKDILMADYVRDPFLKPALLKEKSQRDAFLPDIPAKPPAYEWDKPLPPPLQSESVKHSREYVTKNHDYYCQYSRLVKKKMHHHISISRYLKNIELAQNILNGLMLMKGK